MEEHNLIITKSYLNLHAQCEINFTDFYLLETIKRKTGTTLMVLAPKCETASYSYFVLKIGMESKFFSSLNDLLAMAVSAQFISVFKANAIRRYYMRLIKKINRSNKI